LPFAVAVTCTGPTGSATVPTVEGLITASVMASWDTPSMVRSAMLFSATDTPMAIPAPTPEPPATPMDTAPAVAVMTVPSVASTSTCDASATVLPPMRARVVFATWFFE
jgi:hypothetical protein